MVIRGALSVPKEQQFTKQIIEDYFGDELRALGFISKKNNTEWYGILKGKFFCSVFFIESFHHDILFRVQPLCSRLLNPLKRFEQYANDKGNHCESASWLWQRIPENKKIFDELSENPPINLPHAVFLKRKLEFFRELFFTVVLPYFKGLESFSDIKCEKDWYVEVAAAYLSNDCERYYNSLGVIHGLINIPLKQSEFVPLEEYELMRSIRKAAEQRDMTIVGKCLQKWELTNIQHLREKLPGLFKKQNSITPLITDEYIHNRALSVVKTTYDYGFAIPESMRKDGVEYLPFPMSTPNETIDLHRFKAATSDIIATHFSSILSAHGFVSSRNNLLWHKLNNDIYYQIEFCIYGDATLNIRFFVCTIFDRISVEANCSHIEQNSCMHLLNEMVGVPISFESYPNALFGEKEAKDWFVSRIKCQLLYIALPTLESIKSFDDVSKHRGLNTVATYIINHKDINLYDIDSRRAIKQSQNIKLSKNNWLFQQANVLESQDSEYIMNYLYECKKHNIELLKKEVPDMFK